MCLPARNESSPSARRASLGAGHTLPMDVADHFAVLHTLSHTPQLIQQPSLAATSPPPTMSWPSWNRPMGALAVPTPAKRDEGQPANSTYWMDISAVDGFWAFVEAKYFVYETMSSLEWSETNHTAWTFVLNRTYTNETLLALQKAQRGADSEVSRSERRSADRSMRMLSSASMPARSNSSSKARSTTARSASTDRVHSSRM